MDLVGIIMNAGSSLSVYRAQVATVSHNIANANTPGYARQEAVPTETVPAEEVGTNGYIGRGVALQGVVQTRDQFIENQINTAFSNSASTSAQTDALSTITALDPQGQGGVTDAIGKFYTALRDLNQNPGDLGLRQAVVYSAQDVAKSFNTTVNSISSARSAIDQNVSSLVDKVNGLTASVADLNRRISQAVNSGRTPNDLLDVRQNDIDQLAQMIGARPVPDNHSSVNMVLPDGTSLVSGIVASKLSIQANNSNSNHYDVVFTPADGSASIPLKGSELGGQIGGLLVSRDQTLGSAESSLDALAFDLTTAVNQQHEKGFALDGVTTNQDLFVMLSAPSAAAKNMAVDATVSANPSLLAAAGSAGTGPGDNANLVALIGTESMNLSNGLNVQQGMAKLTSDFGIAVSTVQDSAAFDKNLLADLTNARESSSGVSVDDELIRLTAAQTAYSALTKVITTTNTMLDTLMKLI
jgi:flagellar hook-associated protein 1 FlgK